MLELQTKVINGEIGTTLDEELTMNGAMQQPLFGQMFRRFNCRTTYWAAKQLNFILASEHTMKVQKHLQEREVKILSERI